MNLVRRAILIYTVVGLILIVSIGVGVLASNWPAWCQRAHWCPAGWPR